MTEGVDPGVEKLVEDWCKDNALDGRRQFWGGIDIDDLKQRLSSLLRERVAAARDEEARDCVKLCERGTYAATVQALIMDRITARRGKERQG